ncbi:hypothetical protein AZ54_00720 [Xanthomonas oryzae pv. oryzae PXO86]|nr:hypothetical protein AZ54_00720 [Xanthomonas oryzae pv. oryzae PXO86]
MKCPLQWVVCGRNKFHNQYFRFYHDIKQIMPTIYGGGFNSDSQHQRL